MLTDKQAAYIKVLLKASGLSIDQAIQVVAKAGRSRHPNNAAAWITRAVAEGRCTPSELSVAEGIRLVRALKYPENYLHESEER